MKAGMSRRNFSEGGFCLDKTLLRTTMPAMPSLKALIEKERQTNKKFITAFEELCSLCRDMLNSNTSRP